jgi:hypothetical protein
MEVDGMYENTPWEHLARYAPWIGIAILVAALLYFMLGRAKARGMDGDDGSLFQEATDSIARNLAALGGAALSLGILFVAFWRAAHDTYPTVFGGAAIRLMVVALGIGGILTMLWRRFVMAHATYALVTATAAAAAAVAAYSHTIIAEGQVTAMVLPVGYVVCAIVAALVAGVAYQVGVRNPDLYDVLSVGVFVVCAWFISDKLPVVQFAADSSLYPVTGGVFIVGVARIARVSALPWWMGVVIGAAAVVLGYLFGHWYGITLAAVGLSISGGLDRLRRPSEEFLLARSARE